MLTYFNIGKRRQVLAGFWIDKIFFHTRTLPIVTTRVAIMFHCRGVNSNFLCLASYINIDSHLNLQIFNNLTLILANFELAESTTAMIAQSGNLRLIGSGHGAFWLEWKKNIEIEIICLNCLKIHKSQFMVVFGCSGKIDLEKTLPNVFLKESF